MMGINFQSKTLHKECCQKKSVAVAAQTKVVHNFFKKVDLPKEIKLIEDIHHAGRRGKDTRQAMLNHTKKVIKGLI